MKTDELARYFHNPMKPYKEYKRIIYQPGRVARIILNRPRYLNAMSHALLGELEDAFDRASEDPDCHVIVISGAGNCFSSGDDNTGLTPESAPCITTDETAKEFVTRMGSEKAAWHLYNIEHNHFIDWMPGNKLRTVPKPTIAMVHGYCIFNGFFVAASMDLIFASEDALFLGGGGGSDVPTRKALEISYVNRFITASEALELDIINRVYPDYETLEKEVLAYAGRVADEVPSALRRTKDAALQRRESQASGTPRRTPDDVWRQDATDGHPERYEGKGRARTPVALYNLACDLLSQGKEVPANVLVALARSVERDDRAAWNKALTQDWRESQRVSRTEASSKAWDEKLAKEGKKDIRLKIRELLEDLRK
jgi:enoyl-CoA hydratase